MRKQTKLVAVVSASALLALGASLTSFAASKGTWMMVDGEWYCYDKNGDAYENTFCTSNGKDYYVGDDGQLVRSAWVEDDGNYYFVNSAGQKITNDWRLTAPYDDDSAEEQWYYFKSNGKRAEDEKITYKGKHISSTAKARCSLVGFRRAVTAGTRLPLLMLREPKHITVTRQVCVLKIHGYMIMLRM